ncbi:MAG: L-alanine exporter AlaE [Silicimonas sp.]|nr:L-alanine exporter AlaE [Silicimonas sp.]RZW04442.1 MAG: L-alanine exporter AlaE [Paracoccaceae bacterium]
MRAFAIDTLAAVAFFTIVAGASELLVAGLSPSQVLVTRLLTVPVLVLTGRPYGLWRDAVFGLIRPLSRLGRGATDIAAFISFQVPVYVGILIFAGATRDEILRAAGAAVILMLVASRPYGLFLDWVRRLAGVSAATDHPPV